MVATPIGNLEDITLRALKALKAVDLIIAEDTRISSYLLKYYDIDKPILSYHQHSGENRKLQILNELTEGKNIALMTDAGTPGVSDPGNELIDFLLSYAPDLKVIPVAGASSLTAALSVCGFNMKEFVFLGFMPKKKKSKIFDMLRNFRLPFVFFESPSRVVRTLSVLKEEFGDVRILVARELTKVHESISRGRISEVLDSLPKRIKGEIVVVVEVKY